MKQSAILANAEAREYALRMVAQAPDGYMVTVQERTRSLEQSAKFHAICGDLAKSGLVHDGRERTLPEWKHLLVSGHTIATKQEVEFIRGLEGELLNIRESTAQMGVGRTASLIEYSLAFCAMHEVKLTRTNLVSQPA